MLHACRKSCLSVALFALAACASGEPIVTAMPVAMPVAQPCKVAMPEAPAWPMLQIQRDATMFTAVRATLAEIELRRAYELELEAAVKACH
ncbi:MAG: hypothetical protein ABTQ34_03415 [Bdellovibrionales bacterium]